MSLPQDFDPYKIDLDWEYYPNLSMLDVPGDLTREDLDKIATLIIRWARDEDEFTAIPTALAVYRAISGAMQHTTPM